MKASLGSVETFSLVDGPGIRCVFFFNGCVLRCKYCHNPEMWVRGEDNITVEEVVDRSLRCQPYFKDGGGVTFSGGEPLLHSQFIVECAKELKKNNIHMALDTAGVGNGNYDEILSLVDLVIFDIKYAKDNDGYKDLTGHNINDSEVFIEALNKHNSKLWIRQVIVPGLMDNYEYMDSLLEYMDKFNNNNIEKIEFLPFHTLGKEKYIKLNLDYPYSDKEDMNKDKCNELYNYFITKYNNKYKTQL